MFLNKQNIDQMKKWRNNIQNNNGKEKCQNIEKWRNLDKSVNKWKHVKMRKMENRKMWKNEKYGNIGTNVKNGEKRNQGSK